MLTLGRSLSDERSDAIVGEDEKKQRKLKSRCGGRTGRHQGGIQVDISENTRLVDVLVSSPVPQRAGNKRGRFGESQLTSTTVWLHSSLVQRSTTANIIWPCLLQPETHQNVSYLWKGREMYIRHYALTGVPGAESEVCSTPLLTASRVRTRLMRSRAFSTIRRTPTTATRSLSSPRIPSSQPSISTLSCGFSSLSLTSQPRLPCLSSTSIFAAPSLQTRAFSASAALGAPRRTFNPSRRTQKRRSGFLARLRDKKGQQTLKRRQLKGRKYLSW